MVDTDLWSNEAILISICTTYPSLWHIRIAYKRFSSYTFNGSIARWGGVTEIYLMDSPIDSCEVEQSLALNDFISVIMAVYVEMDLMELPT